MGQLPLWALWIQFLVTIAIAIGAWGIAYRQWRTAHERVVLDLFERRMAVYDELRHVISVVVSEGTASYDTSNKFSGAADRIGMLFGDDVVLYAEKTQKNLTKLAYYEGQIQAHNDGHAIQKYEEHVDKSHALKLELIKFHEEFSQLVLPYVRMTQKL